MSICIALLSRKSFQTCFPQANLSAWYGKKLNLAQQKQAFTNKKKCTATQNKHAKTKAPGLDAFCDIQSGNAAGLYSEEEKKQTDLTVSV